MGLLDKITGGMMSPQQVFGMMEGQLRVIEPAAIDFFKTLNETELQEGEAFSCFHVMLNKETGSVEARCAIIGNDGVITRQVGETLPFEKFFSFRFIDFEKPVKDEQQQIEG